VFFASRRRHTRFSRDWSSDVCSSDLPFIGKEILKEVETRVAEESIPQKIEALKKILNEINLESPVVLINEDESTVNLAVKTFRRSEERRVGKEYITRRWT